MVSEKRSSRPSDTWCCSLFKPQKKSLIEASPSSMESVGLSMVFTSNSSWLFSLNIHDVPASYGSSIS